MKYTSLLLLCFMVMTAMADQQADSLRNIIDNSVTEAEQVKNMLILADYLSETDVQESFQWSEKALKLSEKSGLLKEKAKSLLIIGRTYNETGDAEKAMENLRQAQKCTAEFQEDPLPGTILLNIGLAFENIAKYDSALHYYDLAGEHYNRINYKEGLSDVYKNSGVVYRDKGDYEKAIENQLKSIQIDEELGNLESSGEGYTNVANIYNSQALYDNALEYYNKALDIFVEVGYIYGQIVSYNNIGTNYYYRKMDDTALVYYEKAYEMLLKSGNEKGAAFLDNNIGMILEGKGDYKGAVDRYTRTISVFEKAGNMKGLANAYKNIGVAMYRYNHLDEAIPYLEKCLAIATEYEMKNEIKQAYAGLYEVFERKGNYRKAFEYLKEMTIVKDSLYNEAVAKQMSDLEKKYQAEKKQLEIDKLEQEKMLQNETIEKQEAENKRQQTIMLSFIVGFVFILVFALLLFRMFVQKRKANRLLAEKNEMILQAKEEIEAQRDLLAVRNEEVMQQKEEIEAQRDEIQEQNELVTKQKEELAESKKEITDSIHYARRIQSAILPTPDLAKELLKNYFVIFQPKDIVSGDFYWLTKVENRVVVAVADCTGHGVPGAFMSMLGAAFLNEIVNKEYITHTGVILRKLRKEVIRALQQKGQALEQKDGMDIALCSFSSEERNLQFSGANNPIYIIRSNSIQGIDSHKTLTEGEYTLYEIKGDSMPIAIHERMDKFEEQEIKLMQGDRIYLFSDGLPDQFGGPQGKKLKYKVFKQLLLSTVDQTLSSQGEILETTIIEWMTGHGQVYEQVDDITVLGIEI